jgi:hypothetical protein
LAILVNTQTVRSHHDATPYLSYNAATMI